MENTVMDLENLLTDFNDVSSEPEMFLMNEQPFKYKIETLIKNTYDLLKVSEHRPCVSALPELITKGFDAEQIWQQIELQNGDFLKNSITGIGKLVVAKDRLLFGNLQQEEEHTEQREEVENIEINSKNDNEENLSDDLDESGGSDAESSLGSEKEVQSSRNKKAKPSAVDDEFFKLDEMNKFLLSEEKKLEKSNKTVENESDSDESIDYFAEGSDVSFDEDDQEGSKLRNPRYKDFFRAEREVATKSVRFRDNESDGEDDEEEQSHHSETSARNEESDNEELNNEEAIKSSLALRSERLNRRIEEIEEAAISEKPWQLKGEVTAEKRPQNSLLEEVLEFDISSRPAPVITQETTQILEDVIRQRIKDKAFDDVERKQKPVDTPFEYRKKLLLNEEKSKESLAQIYEKEFIDQREAQNADPERDEEEPKLHKEVKNMMHTLFRKLDALSNFHFTPRPAVPELKVVSNLPAISMEEVAPVAVSDATLLAPEEIKNKTKGDAIGASERTSTDKKRERRKKKQKQKIHATEKNKKQKPVEQKTRKMNTSENKNLKSSTAFFEQLQDEVRSQIKSKGKERMKKDESAFNAKRMKL